MTAIAIDAPRSRVNFWESWPAWSKLSFILGSSIVSNPHLSILVPRLTHPDLGRCHRSHGQVLQSQTNQEASSNSGCRNWRHDTKKRPRSAIRYPCHRGGLPNRRSVEFESCDTFTSTQHPPQPQQRQSQHASRQHVESLYRVDALGAKTTVCSTLARNVHEGLWRHRGHAAYLVDTQLNDTPLVYDAFGGRQGSEAHYQ
jgi:hypothetical protein